ncbi:MAG: glycosyltransferase family 2 protein [Coxiellaceae bacterium]|nr:MAG: glycosyltransferase family 2 protein [Coxiellaceae bacterium]
MPTLSVIIITKNEAGSIRPTLEAVQSADEIIVLDSGSTDSTPEICREFTPHVFITDWPGFGMQKNRALAKASSDWVLTIDADERVPPALMQEIKQVITTDTATAYAVRRLSTYCGKLIKYGAWRNDYKTILFKRGKAEFSNSLVHERVIVEGELSKLNEPLLHETYTDLSEVIDKYNSYSSYGAEERLKQGKQGGLGKALWHGFWTFFRGYILQLGFLDGKEGFMLAVSNAEGSYYRYLKLMYLRSR